MDKASHSVQEYGYPPENPSPADYLIYSFFALHSFKISMLKIGLLSDTHGFLDPKIKEVFKDVDEVWHAGDIGTIELADELKSFKPFFAVYGNIDGRELRIEYPLHLEMVREGLKILIIHIGGYPGNYEPKARKKIEEVNPDIFICGHSHILKVMRDEKHRNMLAMNPGAAGVQGFHKMKTALRFTLHEGKIQNLEAIELGKRGEII